LLIPRFSTHGAAIALIIAKLVNWFLAYILAREKICNFPFMMHLLRPLAAGGLMLAGFHLLHNLSMWLAATSAIIIYLSTLIGLQPEVRRLLLNFSYVKSV
jgi:O-antigen/teichoic acid export membrane protein